MPSISPIASVSSKKAQVVLDDKVPKSKKEGSKKESKKKDDVKAPVSIELTPELQAK